MSDNLRLALGHRHKAQVLQFYTAFDNRNIDQALTMLAPNFVAHMAGIPNPLDLKAFKTFGMTFYSAIVSTSLIK